MDPGFFLFGVGHDEVVAWAENALEGVWKGCPIREFDCSLAGLESLPGFSGFYTATPLNQIPSRLHSRSRSGLLAGPSLPLWRLLSLTVFASVAGVLRNRTPCSNGGART